MALYIKIPPPLSGDEHAWTIAELGQHDAVFEGTDQLADDTNTDPIVVREAVKQVFLAFGERKERGEYAAGPGLFTVYHDRKGDAHRLEFEVVEMTDAEVEAMPEL